MYVYLWGADPAAPANREMEAQLLRSLMVCRRLEYLPQNYTRLRLLALILQIRIWFHYFPERASVPLPIPAVSRSAVLEGHVSVLVRLAHLVF